MNLRPGLYVSIFSTIDELWDLNEQHYHSGLIPLLFRDAFNREITKPVTSLLLWGRFLEVLTLPLQKSHSDCVILERPFLPQVLVGIQPSYGK